MQVTDLNGAFMGLAKLRGAGPGSPTTARFPPPMPCPATPGPPSHPLASLPLLRCLRLAAPAERWGGCGTCVQSKAAGTSTQHHGGSGTNCAATSGLSTICRLPKARDSDGPLDSTRIPAFISTTTARLPLLQLLYDSG
jgi:hypothetical protein